METFQSLVTKAFQYNGIVFGGYVRDLLAGVEPSDLDIKFPSEKEAFKFLSKCNNVSFSNGLSYYGYGSLCKVYKATIDELKVDLVIGDPWNNPDANVNLLSMDRQGIKANGRDSFAYICECIKKREMHLLYTCTKFRANKIKRKMQILGWTVTGPGK